MKRIIPIIIIFILSSCDYSTHFENEEFDTLGINSISVENEHLTNTFKKVAGEYFSLAEIKSKMNNSIQFDFESLELVTREGFNEKVYIVNQNMGKTSLNEFYQLAFFANNSDTEFSPMLIHINHTDQAKLIINYIDLFGSIIQEITIDSDTESITFSNSSNKSLGTCGHDWADCINIMYSELGYGSVSWWVGTAIFGAPWIAGTVLGCGYAACIQN